MNLELIHKLGERNLDDLADMLRQSIAAVQRDPDPEALMHVFLDVYLQGIQDGLDTLAEVVK